MLATELTMSYDDRERSRQSDFYDSELWGHFVSYYVGDFANVKSY